MSLTILLPKNEYSAALRETLEPLLPPGCAWRDPDAGMEGLTGRKLLFAIALDKGGCNVAYYRMLSVLRRDDGLLEGCLGGVVVTGAEDLYTKDVARDMVLAANFSGCAFLGRPLVEATGSMRNFHVQARIYRTDEHTAFRMAVQELAWRLIRWEGLPPPRRILALHASVRATSNTLVLWELVKAGLPPEVEITEICLRNGTIADCVGCSYTTCLHFGERGGCFYGGVMQEAVYPALRRCAGVMMLCPNYNDALSANLTACVNRLTALFRQQRFYDKALFAIVVSGYSGGDIVARQLIDGLNMNKSFYLPARFAMIETANDPGEALALSGIESRVEAFAARIRQTLLFGTK